MRRRQLSGPELDFEQNGILGEDPSLLSRVGDTQRESNYVYLFNC
jgi:hypothetical protein